MPDDKENPRDGGDERRHVELSEKAYDWISPSRPEPVNLAPGPEGEPPVDPFGPEADD